MGMEHSWLKWVGQLWLKRVRQLCQLDVTGCTNGIFSNKFFYK